MRYVVKDEDATFQVDFKIDGNYVYPDGDTFSYRLRSIDGEIILSDDIASLGIFSEDDPEGDVTDQAVITIPAECNTLRDGALFDTKIIEVSYRYKNRPYTFQIPYRVCNFFFFEATPQDVRNYFGLNSGELPDEDVDLVSSYFQILQSQGSTFTDCLRNGGVGNIRANRLIVLKTVLSVFSSVRLRVNQEENDGSSKFLRYLNKIDWDALYADATAEIEELESNLSGEETVTYSDYMPFSLGTMTDAITGEEE